MNIFSKLNKITNLTENEKTLVKYIENNSEDFIKMSAVEISEVAFVSTSTIYRLCQKLNLAGLSELKLQVSMSISEYLKEDTSIDYNYPFKENETQNHFILNLRNNFLSYPCVPHTKKLYFIILLLL